KRRPITYTDETREKKDPSDNSSDADYDEESPIGSRMLQGCFGTDGPCGLVNPSASCMQNSCRCKKDFPKEYCNQTYIDKNGFVHYRRRLTGVTTSRQNVELGNAIFFKYISKGTDRVLARLSKNSSNEADTSTATSASRPQVVVDEIKNFLDARYNMQRIVFKDRDRLDSVIVNPHKKKTTLTEWLYYNEWNTDGRHLTYLNFPSDFVWYADGKYWRRRRRRNKSSIGRLTYVHPAAGDLFYQRMLLCLLEDDREWETTLQEAALTATPAELRTLLAHILSFCQVSDPVGLWKRTWRSMSQDIPYTSSISLNIPGLHIDDSELEDYVLYELEGCLNHCSKSLTDFGIRPPPEHLMSVLRNRLLMEEKSYDREKDRLLPKLNDKQRHIYNLIMDACFHNNQELVFVYGHGGTGKTFLWKTIIYALRSERKIVLAVASYLIISLP
ncbi:DNA helicase, partial [Tanacetum coccineum]